MTARAVGRESAPTSVQRSKPTRCMPVGQYLRYQQLRVRGVLAGSWPNGRCKRRQCTESHKHKVQPFIYEHVQLPLSKSPLCAARAAVIGGIIGEEDVASVYR
jgi:hypothetical protein